MAVDIKKLVAAISPDIYCASSVRNKVKLITKSEGFLAAAEEAELVEETYFDAIELQFNKSPFTLQGLKTPLEQHKLIYDVASQNLEPLYFWILDFINSLYGKTEKLIDNFVASPGSGFFAEFGQRSARMQDEGMKIFATLNTVIRSVINLIYDLKEFKLRLGIYDDYYTGSGVKKEAALLSLKQIWMDNVDIKRGVGSINGLSQQLDFLTLSDGFMASSSVKAVDKIDLNERVKRILKQRTAEFFRWIDVSDKELRKRFEIEKNYLKSQISSAKLYARWAKPYLKAARELEQTASPTSALVKAFNTALFELVLLGQGKYDPQRDVDARELPKSFTKKPLRKYSPIILVEFKFRTIPERSDQRGGYSYRGRVDLTFTGVALNDDEIKMLKDKIAEDDLGDAYKLIDDATIKSFDTLQEDLDDIFEERKETKRSENEEDTNPFSALFSFLKREKSIQRNKPEKKDLSKGIPKDSDFEKVVRSQAIMNARLNCRKVYDTFKKVQGIPA